MRRLPLLLALALPFLLVPPGAHGQEASLKLESRGPGLHQEEHTLGDGTAFRFTISVPKGYSKRKKAPLVLALHYGGEVEPFYGRGLIEGLSWASWTGRPGRASAGACKALSCRNRRCGSPPSASRGTRSPATLLNAPAP